MLITIVSTDHVITLDGVEVRVWDGVTERGVKCQVYVHRLAVKDNEDFSQFEEELVEKTTPTTTNLGELN